MSSPIRKREYATEEPLEKSDSDEGSESGSLPPHLVPSAPPEGEEVTYLDAHRFIKGKPGDLPISPNHLYWFLNQAILRKCLGVSDPQDKKKIELSILQAYSKAASVRNVDSEELGIQTSPVVPQDTRYHRSLRNMLLTRVHQAYEQELGLSLFEFLLIDSPLLKEIIAREWPQPDLDLEVGEAKGFERLVEQLLDRAATGVYPDQDTRILVDFSKYLSSSETKIGDSEKIAREFEKVLLEKLTEFSKKHSNVRKRDIGDRLLSKLHLVAYTSHKGETVMVTPRFLQASTETTEETEEYLTSKAVSKHGGFYGDLKEMLARTGFLLSPNKARRAWLKLADLDSVLDTLGLPSVELGTKGEAIPTVCKDWKEFLGQPLVQKFRDLANEEAPYLKVYPEATFQLLKGLESHSVDKTFKRKGLQDLLQISYFRMFIAMKEAILHKGDIVAFNNQIELIHQEIQNTLGIIEPYGKSALNDSMTARLTSGDDPVIPASLNPRVHLKPSAMHCLASIIAGVEANKDSNKLGVVLAKNSYYHETDNSLTFAKAHNLSVLDEEHIRDGRAKAELKKSAPVDLFVCEFHHNIMHDKQTYRKAEVLKQVKWMIHEGLFAKQFTVVIDNTIDLEDSDDARGFLADPEIADLIRKGNLNVVFTRSAQKFDMLGIDNYYGGITISVNSGSEFAAFNKRMDLVEDQLSGLSFQGLSHIHSHAGPQLDLYRKAVMRNTAKLYRMLPPEAVYSEGSTNPIQISAIEDDRMFFLDFKFPGYPKTMDAFRSCLEQAVRELKVPLTLRPSFSFMNTSLTYLRTGGHDKLRLNVGLDDERTLELYAEFLHRVQKALTLSKRDRKKTNLDDVLAERLRNLALN